MGAGEADGALNRIQFLGKSLNEISTNAKASANEATGFFEKMKAGASGVAQTLKGVNLSKLDIKGLNNYANDLQNGISRTEAFKNNLTNCSEAAKKQSISIAELNNNFKQGKISQSQYNAQLKTLTTSSKLAAVGVKILGTAMNVAFSMGISLAINAIITGIDNLVNSVEKTKEHLDELADDYEQAKAKAEETNQKITENKRVIDQINSNPLDITKKETLETLQKENEQLEAQYKFLKNIEYQKKKQSAKETEAYLSSKNQESYINSVDKTLNPTENTLNLANSSDEAEKAGNWGKAFKDSALAWANVFTLGATSTITSTQKNVTPIEQAQELIDKIKELKKEQSDLDLSTQDGNDEFNKIDEQIENYKNNLQAIETDLDNRQLNLFEDSDSYKSIKNIKDQFNSLYDKKDEVVSAVTAEKDSVEHYQVSISALTESLKELNETLDSTFSSQVTFTSAMDKILSGTSLTSDEVRNLIKLFPQLADKFSETADGWTINPTDLDFANNESLKSVKDSIQSQIEEYKKIIAEEEAFANSQKDIGARDEYLKNSVNYQTAKQGITELTLSSKLLGDSFDYASAKLKSMETSYNNLTTVTSDLIGGMKTVSDALSEQAEYGSISSQTAMDLTNAGYAECLMYDDKNNSIRINQQAYVDLQNSMLDAQITELELAVDQSLETKFEAQANAARAAASAMYDLAGSQLEVQKQSAIVGRSDDDIARLQAEIEALKAKRAELTDLVGGSGKKSGGSATETNKTFDWVQTKLENLQKKTKSLIDGISDYISDKVKTGKINKALKSISGEISAQQKAIATYTKKANSIGLSSGWKEKVQSGNYSISEVKDSGLAEKISSYQEYWNKIVACKDSIKELLSQEQDLNKQKIDIKVNSLSFKTSQKSQGIESKENAISLKSAQGKVITGSDYSSVQKLNKEYIKALESEKSYYTKLRNASKSGSEEWRKWQEKIDDTANSINSAKEKTEELRKSQQNLIIANQQSNTSSKQTKLSNAQYNLDYKTTQGKRVNKSDYEKLIKASKDTNTALTSELSYQIYLQGTTTKKGSEEWQEYQDKIDSIKSSIQDNKKAQLEWNKAIEELPISNITKTLETLDKMKGYLTSAANLKSAQGKKLTESDYSNQMFSKSAITNQQDLVNKYQSLWGKSVANGNLEDAKKYKDLYYEGKTDLNEMLISNEELKDSMRDDVYWRDFEKAHTNAQALKSTLESMQNVINENNLYDDNGAFTGDGIAKVSLTVKQLENAREELDNYSSDINNLNKLYKQGYYTQEEYNQKLIELQQGYADTSSEIISFTNQIKELYKSQSKAELDALNEVIDARSSALAKKKEYYDYDKTIKNKTKDINQLKMQAEALGQVNTAEAKAQKARLQEQIKEAEEDLADTQTEHIYQLQIDGFEDLKIDLQECYDDFVKSLDTCLNTQAQIIEDAMKLSETSADLVKETLAKLSEFYGFDFTSMGSSNIPHFSSGGTVIAKSVRSAGDDGLASLAVGETVLSEKFTNLMPKAIMAMDNISSLADNSNFSKMISNIGKASSSPVVINYDNLINIEGNVDKSVMGDLNKMTKTITDSVINSISKDLRKSGYK